MFDIGHYANNDPFTQLYIGRSTGAAEFSTWNKPRGIRMVLMVCLGSGSGGGAGHSRTAGSAGGGGGGGGSGALCACLVPAAMCPDVLYVQPGMEAAAGAAGNFSWISINQALNAVYLKSGAAVPTAGTAGTGAAVGAAGAAGTISTVTLSPFAPQGTYTFLAGDIGAAGGAVAGANGAARTAIPGRIMSGGSGGAGCTTTNFVGGALTGAGIIPTIPGGVVTGGAGQRGFNVYQPFCSTGGSGGGSNNSGTGGAGGNGGYGSGGGGGGCGTTGGAGGKGGAGVVLITCW